MTASEIEELRDGLQFFAESVHDAEFWAYDDCNGHKRDLFVTECPSHRCQEATRLLKIIDGWQEP